MAKLISKYDKETGIRHICWKDKDEVVKTRMAVLPSPPPHKGYCVYDLNEQRLVVTGLDLAKAKKMAKAMV